MAARHEHSFGNSKAKAGAEGAGLYRRYHMICRRSNSLLMAGALLGVALRLSAQNAPPADAGAAAGGGGQRPAQGTMNIKALPKDISRSDLLKLMTQYTRDLGVGCEFCHAQNPETNRTDFASDANPSKDTARYMITMTSDLDDQYLENMPGRRYGDPITCGTCHRGDSHPSVFVPKSKTPGGRAPGAGAADPPAAPAP